MDNEGNKSAVPVVLDQKAGLKSLGGNQELYRHVLQEYYKENLTILDDLSSAIQDQDYDKAAKIVIR
jgi:HPt (histidine-containing phosphotransfer) domain-containing protein